MLLICSRRIHGVGSQPPKCLNCKQLIENRKKPTYSHRSKHFKGLMLIPIVAHLMEQVYQDATRAAC